MGKKHYSDTKKQSFHNSLILMLILFLSLGIVLVQSFSCLEANSFTEGLAAHYPMDEGKGSTIFDHSGNGNDGTIHGAMWVEGKFGMALSFDGKSTYVEVPDSASLDITDEITIAMWIKVNALGKTKSVVSKSSSSQNTGYIFPYFQYDSLMRIIVTTDVSGWILDYEGARAESFDWSTLSDPYAWHLVVGTYDGSKRKTYVDGVLRAEQKQTGRITTNTNPLVIGNQPGFNEYFNGILDGVRIYNRALSADEIPDLCMMTGTSTTTAKSTSTSTPAPTPTPTPTMKEKSTTAMTVKKAESTQTPGGYLTIVAIVVISIISVVTLLSRRRASSTVTPVQSKRKVGECRICKQEIISPGVWIPFGDGSMAHPKCISEIVEQQRGCKTCKKSIRVPQKDGEKFIVDGKEATVIVEKPTGFERPEVYCSVKCSRVGKYIQYTCPICRFVWYKDARILDEEIQKYLEELKIRRGLQTGLFLSSLDLGAMTMLLSQKQELKIDRATCPNCKSEIKPGIEVINESQLPKPMPAGRKFCIHCGEQILEKSVFCPLCGQKQE